MEKKFKISDKSRASKIIYLSVIAILCVSATIIGIVAANNRKKPDNTPPSVSDDGGNENGNGNMGGEGNENEGDTPSGDTDDGQQKPKLVFVSPAVGTVIKSHSSTVPVFSNTLDEWRIHTGLDIMAELGTEVKATADGSVSAVYNHPMLGMTVEITHEGEYKSMYSGLAKEGITVSLGDTVTSGTTLGLIGDTSISELADEPHLHFELYASEVSVNPLDYFTAESKYNSLGIKSGTEA